MCGCGASRVRFIRVHLHRNVPRVVKFACVEFRFAGKRLLEDRFNRTTMKNLVKLRHVTVPLWLLGAVLLQAIAGGAQPVTRIGAGSVHSLFLRSDGSLWAMGNNG